MKTKLILSILFVALSPVAAAAQTSDGARAISPSDILGTYSFSFEFGGQSFTLKEGGRYESVSGGCTHVTLSEGTYTYEGGVVSIVVTSRKERQHDQSDEEAVEVKPSEDGEDEEEADKKEEEETAAGDGDDAWRLFPVRWGARLYIISEEEMRDFCNAVNAGVEPRLGADDADYHVSFYGAYLGAFYLRDGDEKKDVSGLPEVPHAFREHLLEKPIEGEVVSVDAEGNAAVSLAREGGLREGMRLFVQRDPPAHWTEYSINNTLLVMSVQGATATVNVGNRARAGDKVSTKFQKPRID